MIRNINDKQYYSTQEVAGILGVSRVAIFKKIKSGSIKAQKFGRNYLIAKDDLNIARGLLIPAEKRKEIDMVVKRSVSEYGEAFKKLSKE